MKFTRTLAVNDRETHILAEPQSYDGHPLCSTFMINHRLRFLNEDRFAVACALAYRRYISGSIEAGPVSPRVAKAISELLKPRDIVVSNVSLEAKALPPGARNALIGVDDKHDDGVVVNFSEGRYTPSLLTVNEIFLGTNVSALCRFQSVLHVEDYLAVLCLVAEDLSIGCVDFSKAEVAIPYDADRDNLEELMEAVNIEVRLPNAAEV